ncbi:hypothetical protein [Macrococcus equipercicus]|uniref:PepSY domain-containing protein n=1 Tax=Macrococcus equipercicus TaxID=69967 RepID=A0A9Q9F1B5_9STAP|nr:hypothetical protein [Macrococcus equipercicus]KAA1038401.1 hypothetical protein ERX35_008625 [Macrococcus equipercicus]UTH13211.1 hypothetical protein KFV11_08035 [Macrococcus equipercicus]
MNKKWWIGSSIVVAALVIGYAFSRRYRLLNPHQLLEDIKQKFNGVESSFIVYTPERYKRFGVETQIYRGGITTNFDDYKEEYEFIADAYTGQLIDCIEVTHNN